jgi:hypothetical protein
MSIIFIYLFHNLIIYAEFMQSVKLNDDLFDFIK